MEWDVEERDWIGEEVAGGPYTTQREAEARQDWLWGAFRGQEDENPFQVVFLTPDDAYYVIVQEE